MVVLYHGTAASNRSRIMRSGLRPLSWFSTDIEDAKDFGELAIGVDRRGVVDIWKVDVPDAELTRISSGNVGSKRGTFYRLRDKPKEKPVLVESYVWDIRTMEQRPGKVL